MFRKFVKDVAGTTALIGTGFVGYLNFIYWRDRWNNIRDNVENLEQDNDSSQFHFEDMLHDKSQDQLMKALNARLKWVGAPTVKKPEEVSYVKCKEHFRWKYRDNSRNRQLHECEQLVDIIPKKTF